jgi:uncharacterized Zn finger protein (UPF0148 family)
MTENGSEEGLLVRAEPLGLVEEVCRRMVDVVRVVDGAPPRRRARVGGGDQHGVVQEGRESQRAAPLEAPTTNRMPARSTAALMALRKGCEMKGSSLASRSRSLVCPLCEAGELKPSAQHSARCNSCAGSVGGAMLEALRRIVALPDALGTHACGECGHPEMRRLPDGTFHCPACRSEVLPLEDSGREDRNARSQQRSTGGWRLSARTARERRERRMYQEKSAFGSRSAAPRECRTPRAAQERQSVRRKE